MNDALAVALTTPPFSVLTYAVPDGFALADFPVGLRLLVPVGRTLRVGVVAGCGVAAPPGVTLRPALWPLERAPLCDAGYLELAASLASRHMATVGRILGAILPRGLRSAKVVFTCRAAGLPKALTATALWRKSSDERLELAPAWRDGTMACRLEAGESDPLCCLAASPPWPVRPGAAKQVAVLDALCDAGPMALSELKAKLGPGTLPLVRRLAELGLVRIEELETAAQVQPAETSAAVALPPLTDEQAAAMDSLLPALDSPDGAARLVYGVTGSGKTRLYMELVRRTLERGRQVLLLAPEVALAEKLHRAACRAFPEVGPAFYHGYQSPALREALFWRCGGGSPPAIVAGTRSALLLPLRDLGLIVLDEEHDGAFKQEDRLPYQAKEVGFFRARQSGALFVLGSATPDVKTFHAAQSGHVPMVRLERRVGGGGMPRVEIVDMRGAAKLTGSAVNRETGDRVGVLTDASAAALAQTVAEGGQAMILLNRRGYAPLLFCLDCETPVRCPHCDLSLTFHKDRERLVCHYCGHARPHPSPCPGCGGTSFLPMGVGAEMLEEQLAGVLPAEAAVARLDRDVARRPEEARAVLADFAAGRSRVLVGTQMLSKGHHFPDVTLVIAADADLGRNLPDYRASERAFQLLTQVAGRAGRGERPGRVLIQTRMPEDPFFGYVLRGDYEGFFDEELSRRRRLCYPPFVRLGLVRLSFPRDYEEGYALAAAAGEAMRRSAAAVGARLLGPAPAPLALVAGRRRLHCLIKSPDWPGVRQVFAAGAKTLEKADKVRCTLDLDPVDML
ncbi:replication restart helicase PriA [Solidesulfovibrio magneticus]|uniref:Replication restart protein PriA n=1 Tax=Solidesulfovibrio magneticus (strain ATCC 700980 / DSM 13731 / RS-1) TaxID=573370 RepID=C4XU37_SOLM1|nr:primosomal protein N' [Solidesulfovibrio magneticus]BAH76059.1 primosomal protein N' [Solidesulfovibrio magneticus RS-1]